MAVEPTTDTVAAKTAVVDGGGINVAAGTRSAVNCLLATNSAATGPDVPGRLDSGGNNLIGNSNGTVVTGISACNITDANPMLGPFLADAASYD